MLTVSDIQKQCKQLGIDILVAKKKSDASRQGIHLLCPSLDELQDAIDTAEKDGFCRIFLHTHFTWPSYCNDKVA